MSYDSISIFITIIIIFIQMCCYEHTAIFILQRHD